MAGECPEALAELNRAMQLDSVSPPALYMTAKAYIIAVDTAKAHLLAERLWNRVPRWRPPAALLLAQLGYGESARAILREPGGRASSPRHAFGANLYLALGDTARALTAMQRAAAMGSPFPTDYSLTEPEFDPLRRSSRFAAIVRAVGLDERILTSPTGGRPR